MIHSLWNITALVLVLAVAIGAGNVVCRLLHLPRSAMLDTLLVSTAFGLGLLIIGIAVLGWLQLLRPEFILGWFVLMGLVALGNAWHGTRVGFHFATLGRPVSEPEVYHGRWLLLAAAAFAVVYLLSTMAPPLDGDTLWSYLDVPRQFLKAGGIVSLPYELHSPIPSNIQILSILALVLAGDELAQMLAGFTMAAGASLVIFALGRRYFSGEIGLLAALIFFTMNTVQSLVPSTKVNLGWALFDLLAVYAVVRWAFDTPRNNRWLLAGGVLSGLASGTLYSAGFTALLVSSAVVSVLWRTGVGNTARSVALYAVPVVLLGAPWLIRNWMEVGNPVFPVLNSVFGVEPLVLARYGDNNPAGIIKAPWDMATGYTVGHFGKPVGPVILGALPGLLMTRPIHQKIKVALAFAAVWYVLWYMGVQRPRNLLTVLGIISIVSAYGYVALGQRSNLLRYGFLVLAGVYLLFNLGMYARGYLLYSNYGSYILGLESREQFLERTLTPSDAPPTLSMLRHIETLPQNARIVAMYIGSGYYVDRPFIHSGMVDRNFSVDTAADATSLVGQWREAGITHVFINEGYLSRAASWGSDLAIVRRPDFQARCLREVFADDGQSLYELTCQE